MVSINTNISSLIAQNSLRNSTSKLNNTIEQMTTGYKINHAKDNAANYSIAVDMSTKIGAYDVAEENCAMALDLVNTANEALDLIADKYLRIRALKEQFDNGTYDNISRETIENEAKVIFKEIQRIVLSTEYNGKKLFGNWDLNTPDADYKDSIFNFQIGIDQTNLSQITITTSNQELVAWTIMNAADITTPLNGLDIDFWDELLTCITQKQTELGAVQNRLESALEAICTQRENLISSRSTLKDADIAKVSSEYIKQQILQQASATLLATANQSPSIALQLI